MPHSHAPIAQLPARDGDDWLAVVEARQGSRSKLKFDPALGLFRLHHT